MARADFYHVDFSFAIFDRTNLYMSNFCHSRFEETKFMRMSEAFYLKTLFYKSYLKNIHSSMVGESFLGALSEGARFISFGKSDPVDEPEAQESDLVDYFVRYLNFFSGNPQYIRVQEIEL